MTKKGTRAKPSGKLFITDGDMTIDRDGFVAINEIPLGDAVMQQLGMYWKGTTGDELYVGYVRIWIERGIRRG